MSELFRREVLEARRAALFGHVVLRSPPSFAWWCTGAALTAAALVALLCFGQYTRRTRVQGVTVPAAGVLKLTTPQPGIVVERYVDEGQAVQAGDILFVVSSDRISEAASGGNGAHAAILEQLQRRRASLADELRHRIRLLERQQDALARRRTGLDAEAAQLRQELATQEAREASAAEQAARFDALARQGFVSVVTARQRHDDLLEQRARRQALQRSLLAVEREIAATVAELRQVPLRVAREQSEVQRELALLQQEIVAADAARRVVVTAPLDGVVTAIAAERGSHAGLQALATLLPAGGAMEAHLFAPSRSAGFVQPGQAVRVRFAAYPFQKFGQYDGEVAQVSRVALAPAELPVQLALSAPAEPLYRITVRLAASSVMAYGVAQPLAAGMQLEADVMQDRRRLIEWVFEPLIALGRKV
jgi:membrane fusion protein